MFFVSLEQSHDEITERHFAALSGVSGRRIISGDLKPEHTPKILEADALGITDVKMVTDGSDDQTLNFSFKLTKPIAVGQKLTFVVEKKDKDKQGNERTVESAQYVFVVGYTMVAPEILTVALTNGKIAVTGNKFFDAPQNPLRVELHPTAGGSGPWRKPRIE